MLNLTNNQYILGLLVIGVVAFLIYLVWSRRVTSENNLEAPPVEQTEAQIEHVNTEEEDNTGNFKASTPPDGGEPEAVPPAPPLPPQQ